MREQVDFAIVTPLEEERRAMLAKLPQAEVIRAGKHDARVYHSIELPVSRGTTKSSYSIVVSDLINMGRVDAAIVAKDLVQRWSPRYILLVGIAGGFERAGVNVGDVLIADQIVDPEQQKLTSDGPEIRWSSHLVDPCLLVAAKQLSPDHWQPASGRPVHGTSRRHIGTVCTGDKVRADDSLNGYAKTWPRLIGVEMEAGGVASAAFQSVPAPGFFMVRGVSDLADKRKDASQTRSWRNYACDIAAQYAATLLNSAPVPFHDATSEPAPEKEEALLCPKCGKRKLRVHSRSQDDFVMICDFCSVMAMVERSGPRILSFVVPGVVTLVGFEVVEHYLHEHGGSVVDSLIDIADFLTSAF